MGATRNFLTIRQAAAFLGRSPEDVRDLIAAGDLRGREMSNTGGMMIPREDLVAFLKSRKEWTKFKKTIQPKAIVMEPDFNKALMMKGTLERTKGVRVRVAADLGTLKRELEKSGADLIAVLLMDEAPLDEELAAALQKARQENQTRVLVYHQKGDDLLDRKPEIKLQFSMIPVDVVVSYSARLQPVIDRIAGLFAEPPKGD